MSRNNKKFLKSVSLLVALLLLVLSLAACTGGKDGGEDSADSSGSTPTDTAAQVTLFDGSKYCGNVVYPDLIDEELADARRVLTGAMRKAFGASAATQSESVSDPDGEKFEILLGKTNRPESAIPQGVLANDGWYFIGVVNNKLVINGANGYMIEQAVRLFIEKHLEGITDKKLTVDSGINTLYRVEDFCHEAWKLYTLPYYKGGDSLRTAPIAYNAGSLLTAASDAVNSKQAVVSRTSPEEFEAYVQRLVDFGFEKRSENTIESNRYVTLQKDNEQVYAYYTADRRSVNVILEPVGVSPEEFSYTVNAEQNNGAQFYMYGLEMHQGDAEVDGAAAYPNNGMLLVIKLADNGIILVDGGNASQISGENGARLDGFLRDITGTPEGEKVRIACWFLTHGHSDHYGGFAEFINNYSSKYTLERICANLPDYDDVLPSSASALKSIGGTVRSLYPDCKEIKLHTGQSVQLADVMLQVLYTHEDSVNLSTGKAVLEDVNDSSTVLRVSAGEMSMIVTGDMNMRAQEMIMNAFSEKTLSASILQVSHHGFNNVSSLYNAVKAPIAIIPQSEGYMSYNKPDASAAATNRAKREILTALRRYATIYYSGSFSNTVGFAVRNGEVTVIYGS